MKKSLYVLIIIMCYTVSYAQGVYRNDEFNFEFSFDNHWELIEKQDSVVLLNPQNQIKLSVDWSQTEENTNVNRKSIINDDNLRIYNSFSYYFFKNDKGEKNIKGVSRHSLEQANTEVVFTAKIPQGYVDYDIIYTLNQVTRSFRILSSKGESLVFDQIP